MDLNFFLWFPRASVEFSVRRGQSVKRANVIARGNILTLMWMKRKGSVAVVDLCCLTWRQRHSTIVHPWRVVDLGLQPSVAHEQWHDACRLGKWEIALLRGNDWTRKYDPGPWHREWTSMPLHIQFMEVHRTMLMQIIMELAVIWCSNVCITVWSWCSFGFCTSQFARSFRVLPSMSPTRHDEQDQLPSMKRQLQSKVIK